MNSKSIVDFLNRRQVDPSICSRLEKRFQVTDTLIDRLGLEAELDGHTGCVNCLEWDPTGSILASASDDLQVIIWDPFKQKKLHTIQTGHQGNIFSVKFLPENPNTIVTGAGDFVVRVHNLVCKEVTRVCICHGGRVKRLAVTPDQPHLFWSAAEDGIIRQFDTRVSHNCLKNEENILVDLKVHTGEYIEAKCLSINPVRTELLAVGANDPFIRIYDRRMIHLVQAPNVSSSTNTSFPATEDNLPVGCVQYFVPGHVPSKKSRYSERDLREYSATYVTFGSNGTDLLVNLGNEQIYLYDIQANTKSLLLRHANENKDIGAPLKEYCNGICSNARVVDYTLKSKIQLPEHINAMKLQGNAMFERELYTKSINIYNQAIDKYPNSSIFYANRAAAYMKRDWLGDMYAALRDCVQSLSHDSSNAKAHFRLARCLFELTWFQDAQRCLDNFRKRFPTQAQSLACAALERDIQAKISSSARGENEASEFEYMTEISGKETEWREAARDYELRYCGHCNTTTDIKEANFFGADGQYIVAGSDDGSIFIWDRQTTNNIKILKGDSSIVNCLQPHPTFCLLATSGIEHFVRLWSPIAEGKENFFAINELDEVALSNQRRMRADPFDVVFMNMGIPRSSYDDDQLSNASYCRTS